MTVTYGLNSATAHFYFLIPANKKSEYFHSEFYELRAESYTSHLFRYGIVRCYYFARNVGKKLRRLLLLESGLIGEHALLCTRKTSTRSNPELVLYLDAVRGVRKKYDQLNMPVDLNFTGNQKTTGASAPPRGPHESDDGPPTKAVETFPSRCKSMKDGNYLNLSAILNLETRHDGRQRAMLTSHDGNERFSTLENVLVVPAEDYLTTGCCELENTGIFICPTGADHLLLRAPGVELEMVYADVHALEAQLS
ncbi:hypothetical protein FOZ60_005765 [Perkinsus olseni]|uniref:Uncharacterized protein n=1 Tax=Perkinsus olseni TaxID=32597 RepID=A0A7J6NQ54_PEROL|nr:hypothetical protein FOZ60_005765 [Perkinsus olseni]